MAAKSEVYNKLILITVMTFSNPRTPSAPIFKELSILPIFSLVKVLNSIFIHDYLNSKHPTEILHFFNFSLASSSHEHNTSFRGYGGITVPCINTKSFGEISLTFQEIKFWNQIQLTHHNQNLTSLSTHSLKKLSIPMSIQ